MCLFHLFQLLDIDFNRLSLFVSFIVITLFDLIFFIGHIKLAIVNFGLFLQSREENVVNALLLKVLVPMGDQLLTQVVCLVDQKYKLFFALFCAVHFLDVLFQICTVEEVGIPCVDDL